MKNLREMRGELHAEWRKTLFLIFALYGSHAFAQIPSVQAMQPGSTISKQETVYAKVISKVPVIESTDKLSRLLGYRVTYEYAGKQYVVQMADDPGSHIAVQIQNVPMVVAPSSAIPQVLPEPVAAPAPPVAIVPPTPAQVNAALTPPPPPVVIYTPSPVYAPAPVYIAPPAPYFYPSHFYYGGRGVSFGIGVGHGFRGRGWHR